MIYIYHLKIILSISIDDFLLFILIFVQIIQIIQPEIGDYK
ncbi:hypothetical protein GCWU000342_00094 [Shuttleworthella satelles DSM 14600]|uniref:Uncharacterized protein n=1 Tax=Shuttleworthella satelles DSM 14600 TaxID=626523 RepID=C4G7Y1_9FIRM|nr:hypothetical protein GCWU000342_00094 [Shuttleworthia satelles DSM 14600]